MRTKIRQAGWTGTILGLAFATGLSGCKSNQNQPPATIVDANNGPDPAAANLAPVDPNATTTAVNTSAPASSPTYATRKPSRVLGQREYGSQSASGEQYPEGQGYSQNYNQGSNQGYDQDYDQYENQVDSGQQALYAEQAPPPLPQYEQPELTEPGYEWTPGYWNSGPGGYFWVPGAWVAPPYQQALWTPGYWGYEGNRYHFHRGYWARHIGFYGGVNYGFGYGGSGYEGGYWNGDQFYYNNRVNRVNYNDVHSVYERNVSYNTTNHYSYNGPGGYDARPRPQELAVLHEQRTPPMQVQVQRVQAAAQNRSQFFAENHGRPAVVAAPEHLAADRTPPQPIRQNAAPVQAQRGGFGQQPGVNPAQQRNVQQQQVQNQQRVAQQQQAQQRNVQQEQQQERNTQVAQQQQRAQQQQNVQREQQQQTQQRAAQQQTQQRAQQQENAQRAQQQSQQRVQQQNAQRVQQQARPAQPQARPEPQQTRPQPQAQTRPEPQQTRPQPQQQARPEPQARPQPQQQARPQQQAPHSEPAERPKR